MLDAVKDDLASCGIELDFKHPYGNKQGFLKYVQSLRDDIAQREREIEDEKAAKAKAEGDKAVSGVTAGES